MNLEYKRCDTGGDEYQSMATHFQGFLNVFIGSIGGLGADMWTMPINSLDWCLPGELDNDSGFYKSFVLKSYNETALIDAVKDLIEQCNRATNTYDEACLWLMEFMSYEYDYLLYREIEKLRQDGVPTVWVDNVVAAAKKHIENGLALEHLTILPSGTYETVEWFERELEKRPVIFCGSAMICQPWAMRK